MADSLWPCGLFSLSGRLVYLVCSLEKQGAKGKATAKSQGQSAKSKAPGKFRIANFGFLACHKTERARSMELNAVWISLAERARISFMIDGTQRVRGISPERVKDIVEALKAYEPEKIILFGSLARGDADRYSDIDLVVIKRTDKRFVERLVEAARYLDLPVSVDLFVYTPEEFEVMAENANPFIERVRSEGRIIYERSS